MNEWEELRKELNKLRIRAAELQLRDIDDAAVQMHAPHILGDLFDVDAAIGRMLGIGRRTETPRA